MKKVAKKVPAQPKKGGRPPLPAGKRRDQRLNDVRFSASELALLKRRAAESGQRWTTWVRARLGL